MNVWIWNIATAMRIGKDKNAIAKCSLFEFAGMSFGDSWAAEHSAVLF